jgi:alpha-galactosidase
MRALFRFGFFALFPFAASVRAEPADLTKPVQVFILLGQSNMVGLGKVTGPDGSLEHAVKAKKKYPYLVDAAGAWTARDDVRYVRVMVGRAGGMQVFNDEWLKAGGRNLGPELGIGHPLGDAISAPVMLLKSCIGNRSLGWDLLPPGSPRTLHDGKVYPAYKERPDSWAADPAKGVETPPPLPWVDKKGKPIDWYAGKQYDDDVANAKRILADLKKHYPGASHYEVAGFFFWQGEKDGGNAAHAAEYEANLVRFIRRLRQDFETPRAKFVLATLGEAVKGSGGNGGKILEAQLAVDGESGKHPEFKGNVATVYAHPLSKGGSGNSHYNGNAETYMEVGEAMGRAMADLLKK